MKNLIRCAALCAAALPAFAAETPVTGIGLRAGTSGIGVEGSFGLNDYLDLRAGYYFGSVSHSLEEDGIDYDGDFQFSSGVLMLDLKPFGGGFRISAGGYTASPEIELTASGDNEQFDIGVREYTADGRLDGAIDLGSTAPYIGIGWGGTTNGNGFGISFDLGVMFTGSPEISLSAEGRACDSTFVPCDPSLVGFDVNDPNDPNAEAFREQLEQERQDLEDDAEDYEIWPVVMLGLHYRF